MAAQYGPRGIRCNAVAPGVIETPMTEGRFDDPVFMKMNNHMTPYPRLGNVDDCRRDDRLPLLAGGRVHQRPDGRRRRRLVLDQISLRLRPHLAMGCGGAQRVEEHLTMSDQARSPEPTEAELRRDLAAAYRLVALFGWDDAIATHISVRLPEENAFLINPFGMLFEEIRPADLVKVDMDGAILGQTNWSVNKAGFVIHSAIHRAPP